MSNVVIKMLNGRSINIDNRYLRYGYEIAPGAPKGKKFIPVNMIDSYGWFMLPRYQGIVVFTHKGYNFSVAKEVNVSELPAGLKKNLKKEMRKGTNDIEKEMIKELFSGQVKGCQGQG